MGKEEEETVKDVFYRLDFRTFGIVTVSLPAGSLLFSFLWGLIFIPDEVNETVCNCTNFIPSISAVTGVSPGKYVWRICIALHSAPRFIIAVLHYNYYLSLIHNVKPSYRPFYKKFVSLNFWLNTVENACLVLVSYISNRENYPVHEKIFVVFMVMSLCYMLTNTILFNMSRPEKWTELDLKSYAFKKYLWIAIMISTGVLLYFFAQHRLFCIPGAFSWFSLSEFFIAYINMAYHVTAIWEFKDSHWVNGVFSPPHVTNNHIKSH
ncbi:post-GPI attachment to proteins factor 2-like [Lingula anatina]|uniref:Post-GPI attachment to proteins factor 2-like n=1 Tax=Lingula anatina TaxID=7574 RepID=A0A1S3HX34_LINAN|nr:post-GPI attachment to proteins factor 2-like [Lingula anatina]XP_013390574.1 post-GPI attachment to proteins factor 2-like [Lingula anatina]|eukprot:XP_013390573.1 post-GPI attachment to proteins factor 2-like [Lingula anatina]